MNRPPFKIKLFLKEERIKNDGSAPIYARVRLNLQKMELATNQSAQRENWDNKAENVINLITASTINQHLQAFKAQIAEAYSQLYIARSEITLEGIKAILRGDSAIKEHTLIRTTEEHNKEFSSLVGIKYSHGSYKNYKTTLKYLQEFVPTFTDKSDIPLRLVNYKFCEAFFIFLTTQKDCHTNGANKQMQRLKKLINYSIKLGYLQTNPMATYTLQFDPSEKIALSLEEINSLAKLKLQRDTLEKVRDVFLLQCFTGLAYSDVRKLCTEDIYIGSKDQWIKLRREKTKVMSSIPLLEPAIAIIAKYMPFAESGIPFLPVITNQKMNSNLKILQELAGINKSLTTHLARHSFATITLSNGVPLETVSKMLGHTKLATTQIYAKVLDSKIAEDMSRMNRVLSKSNETD